jgi:hypothetical protein
MFSRQLTCTAGIFSSIADCIYDNHGIFGRPPWRPSRHLIARNGRIPNSHPIEGAQRVEAYLAALKMKRTGGFNMQKTLPICGVAILFLCANFAGPALAAGGSAASRPPGTETVRNGTHFLVRLDQEMNTGKDKVHDRFEVETIEPLETSRGHFVPVGAKIVGHISRIEPAGLTGHAKLWLTFDEIDTSRGTLPIVAEVLSVPGEFSVRQGQSKEGEIEARTDNGTQLAEATAVGAAKGGAPGVVTHNGKAAAMGAAAGGVAAFLASSGIGQEIVLLKGTKIELVLDRALYLTQ